MDTTTCSRRHLLAGKGEGEQLSPQDTALALLSFLRDELPADGIGAERRFVNMFLPILDRAFENGIIKRML